MSFSRTKMLESATARGEGRRKRSGQEEILTWALDVTDDGTGLVVHELDTALGDTTTGTYKRPSSAFNSLYLSHVSCGAYVACGPLCSKFRQISRTGSAKDTGDLDELDGSLS